MANNGSTPRAGGRWGKTYALLGRDVKGAFFFGTGFLAAGFVAAGVVAVFWADAGLLGTFFDAIRASSAEPTIACTEGGSGGFFRDHGVICVSM